MNNHDIAAAAESPAVAATLCQPRQGLPNFFAKVHAGKPVTVAYFGGSITAANGWRPKTSAWLQARYPMVKFTEVNAAIGGTGSDLGAFRLGHDVLAHKPDLVFVEFAVNDGGARAVDIHRQMEGIVRQIWAADPATDICYVYTFKVGYEDALGTGFNPPAASADELLADYFGIPSINVALETVHRQQAGKLIYVPAKGPDGHDLPVPDGVTLFSNDSVHPLDAGHEIYAHVIADALTQIEPLGVAGPHVAKPPFIVGNWANAKQVPIKPSMLGKGWSKLPADDIVGQHFANRLDEIWQATTPGATLDFKYKGTGASIYDLLGPDGGMVAVSIDGKPPFTSARFDKYCTYHRLATLRVGSDLPDAVHTVHIELLGTQPDRAPASSQEKGTFDPKKYDGTALRFGSILVLGDVVE